MKNLKELLILLMDGKYHSGVELSKELKMTRAGVWKKIKKLIALDIEIITDKKQGYCIPGGLELFKEKKILYYLTKSAVNKLIILDSVCSTNDFLWKAIKEKKFQDNNRLIVLAEQQVKGKGRLGRVWHSPFGRNVYMSYSYSFINDLQNLSGLSLVVGLAVITALQAFGVSGLLLKWPNDILCNNKKLAGILIETQQENAGPVQVVIGIGINLYIAEKILKNISNAIDVHSILGEIISRNRLVASLVNSLYNHLTCFIENGFKYFLPQFAGYDFLKNKIISIKSSLGTFQGLMVGINEYGGIKIKINDAVEVFYCADIEKVFYTKEINAGESSC